MSELVADCPRCDASKMTFDLISSIFIRRTFNWQNWYEAFCVCRHCRRSTVFVLADDNMQSAGIIEVQGGLHSVKGGLNKLVRIEDIICIKDFASIEPPEHLPEHINAVFVEGAKCFSVGCYNAAGTMFRLSIDLATKDFLPENNEDGLNKDIRRSLGLRLPWLFNHKVLPEDLRELSACIKEDGNDGAHTGTLKKEDVEDLIDFTSVLLERLYTAPERLRIAGQRRSDRRDTKK